MNDFGSRRKILSLLCFAAAALNFVACAEIGELKKPEPTVFYGAASAPRANEFRWANGERAKTFDPAFARSPAEMQAVRLMFDGLTEWNQKDLTAQPALALRWEHSADFKTWTFYLRDNAIWSNNRKIVAADFVRSWQRLADSGAQSPNVKLLDNVARVRVAAVTETVKPAVKTEQNGGELNQIGKTATQTKQSAKNVVGENEKDTDAKSQSGAQPALDAQATETPDASSEKTAVSPLPATQRLNVEAVDDQTLRVNLIYADPEFAKLAAHSALRPIAEGANEFDKFDRAQKIQVSGAFRFASSDKSDLVFERNPSYWNQAAVKLEKVRFVPMQNIEAALAAYRAGEVDAVTNVHLEPLALKLFQSYQDFERTPFNAVTFYKFNPARAPFNDSRVRRALAMALDREQLVNDDLDGASFAAAKMLPGALANGFAFDAAAAQKLFAEAGFPNGLDFPKIKLLTVRNDQQQRVARAVAAQWQKNLGVETEIAVSSLPELENSAANTDFDLVRRVVVLPTTDEAANLRLIFDESQSFAQSLANDQNRFAPEKTEAKAEAKQGTKSDSEAISPFAPNPAQSTAAPLPLIKPAAIPDEPLTRIGKTAPQTGTAIDRSRAQTTADAAADALTTADSSGFIADDESLVIPLYFASSYALVKPYVSNFELNSLDAPSLAQVEIRTDWRAE